MRSKRKKFLDMPADKQKFFLDLHQAMLRGAVCTVIIKDAPGFKIRLMACKLCRSYYWFTDEYEDLDFCPECQVKYREFKHGDPRTATQHP